MVQTRCIIYTGTYWRLKKKLQLSLPPPPTVLSCNQPIKTKSKSQIRIIHNFFSDMSDDKIMKLNLPTGIPFYYDLDENMKPVVSMQFMGDPETVQKAMDAVAAQGKSK